MTSDTADLVWWVPGIAVTALVLWAAVKNAQRQRRYSALRKVFSDRAEFLELGGEEMRPSEHQKAAAAAFRLVATEPNLKAMRWRALDTYNAARRVLDEGKGAPADRGEREQWQERSGVQTIVLMAMGVAIDVIDGKPWGAGWD